MTGQVLAAGKPVRGSLVELYATGAGGPTRRTLARSNDQGSFTLTYDNPGGDSLLYVIASRGKVAGHRVGRVLRFMDTAGSAQSPVSNVVLSEQTTVASAYGLAQFLRGKSVAGPSPGLPNAAMTVSNLVEPDTGKLSFVLANSPNGVATEALPTFNTLANALASCTRGTKRDCRELFAAVAPGRGKGPHNTLAAMLSIAHHPQRATRALFELQRSKSYQPALEERPDAWTLALVYTSGGFDAPGRMAFDAQGRVWSNNNFEPPGTGHGHGLVVLSPTGQPILDSPVTGGGVNAPGFGMAGAQAGRAWVANFGGNSISLFSPEGLPLSPEETGFTQGSLVQPQGLAVDQQGSIWVPNFAGSSGSPSVTVYRHGDPNQSQVVTGGGINRPFDIAIDSQGNAWVTDNANSAVAGAVTKITREGASVGPITGGGMRSPQGIAVDSHDNLWVANLFARSITQIKPTGRIAKRSPIGGASFKGPWGIAVDGADHVWVAGFVGENLTEVCGTSRPLCPKGTKTGQTISPRGSGYTSLGLQHVTAVQIDQSGNVWLANNWSSGAPLGRFVGGNGLIEFVGLAAPVKTPLIGPPQRP